MKTDMQTKTDVELKDDVLAELKWEPSIRESRIGVITSDGIVTLTGTVASWPEKSTAERATQRVFGVMGVANELAIELPSDGERGDADIARAAANALQWHISVPRDRVEVSVTNGWLTLKGDLEWQYQKTAAGKAVHHLWGVKGVINEIAVRPQLTPQDVKRKIVTAMERQSMLDAGLILVEVDGGRVSLKGTVRSWAERNEAAMAAWSAPGVTKVDNDIQVTYSL